MIEKYVDAEELKRLFSTLGIVLGFLLIAGLFASIVVPGLRNANKPETPTPISPVGGEIGWLDPAEAPPRKGGVIPPVDPKTLIEATPELVSRGKILFEANCTPCHGPLGHGDGPAAPTMSPRPRNLTSPDGWTNGYGLPGIYKTLSEGIKGTSMASFDYLTKKDRMAVGHYVQSMGDFPKQERAQAIADLSKELASAGEKIPNRIPVSMAMAVLEKEFSLAPPLATDQEDQSPGAQVFRRVIVDPLRAAQVLAQSRLWRTSARDLAAAVLPDTPGNGFSVNTATLSPSEWQAFYSELLRRSKTQ
jgi:mono/diheme cytochrome c family protein